MARGRLIVLLACASGMMFLATSGHMQAAQKPTAPAATQSSATAHRAVLDRYCVRCHNEKLLTAGLALDTLDINQVSARGDVWEKVIKKLQAGSMPPLGSPRPDGASYDALTTFLEGELDRAATANPHPGFRPPLHRLNRAEYQNAIRDLLALEDLPRELDIATLLPADDASYGFDNIADALGTSPTLIERYLEAAQKVSRLAIGDPTMPLIVDTYRVSPGLPQDNRFDGMPFGTRGGVTIRRHFQLDGEYAIRIALAGGQARERHQVEVTLDGERIGLFTLEPVAAGRGRGGAYARQGGQPLELRHRVSAGPRRLTVTFIKKTSALSEDLLPAFTRSGQGDAPEQPSLASVTVSGPYEAARPTDTPSRRRIFVCQPVNGGGEGQCAKQILTTLARRAYRRAVSEADLQVLTRFYEEGQAEGGFEAGIQRALERVLVSPSFLFRVERPFSTAGGAVRPVRANNPQLANKWRIDDVELASRLSFFLWSSIPDDELLDLAIRGALKDPATFEKQVRRMLADPRSAALVSNFAGQWLFLRNVDGVAPDPRVFPDFDDGLRQAMRRETELFFESIVKENRSALDFLTAKYTFVNERLAKHYEIPNVYGDHFRRVSLENRPRTGLLGHASILTVTSYAHRTSPVLRGKWMLENVLGTPPPPPPPNVPTLQETSSQTGKPLTMREAMVQHRSNPVCSTCHSMMDPLGFAFENFDAVGRWRTQSGANTPVDASGVLADGTKFEGASGLIASITRRPEQFVTTLTERLLTYALGRGVEFYDAPAIRAIVRQAAQDDYRFSALVLGITKSLPFQWRASDPPASQTQPVAMHR